jgi:hypothetical protein
MKSKLMGLRLAALIAFACVFSSAFADGTDFQVRRLTWMPPTENDDGSPLTDLQGYYVYQGDSPDALYFYAYADVLDPSINVFLRGTQTRYFAVSSFSFDGIESARSEVLAASPE